VSPLTRRTHIVVDCRLCSWLGWEKCSWLGSFFVCHIWLRFFVLSYKLLLVSVFHVVRSDFCSIVSTHTHISLYITPFSCPHLCVVADNFTAIHVQAASGGLIRRKRLPFPNRLRNWTSQH
jgi:hypothetical protein